MTSPSESTELEQWVMDNIWTLKRHERLDDGKYQAHPVAPKLLKALEALLAQEYSRGLDAALASLPEGWSKAGDFTSYSIDTAHKAGYNQALTEARAAILKKKEESK